MEPLKSNSFILPRGNTKVKLKPVTLKKGGLIPRYQTGAAIKDAAIGMIPIVGTYQDYKKFRDDPTWGNFGWLAASAVGDALFFTGAGAALKGIKAAKAAAKSRALLTANRYGRSQAGFRRGLEYGASKGDVKSMFQNLRNYKGAEQKQLAAEAAARQQIIGGVKGIGTDLGQDMVINTIQGVVSEHKGGNLVSDGRRFKFKKSRLIKNAESQNSKRDMRKKIMKSDRPTYSKPIAKKQQGGTLDYSVEKIPINPDIFTSWNSIETSPIKIPDNKFGAFINSVTPTAKTETVIKKPEDKPVVEEKEVEIIPYKPTMPASKGLEIFNKLYDELEKEMPEAKEYRQFLTTVANHESGFNSSIKNKNAPAYGYFQFMQDDKKYNNIRHFAGVDTQTFLSDPKLQIKAAIALAKANERSFSQEDLEAAKNKGISKWGMLGGAWLGGVGGLRNYLLHNKNISDKHWSPTGAGIDMENQIKRYNF